MEYFYKTNAAELTPLKTELMDVVSSCLMKEPPFEATQSGLPTATTAPASPANDGASTVAQIRELVHLISRHDGEFVLKLALYARHELHLRRSPSFLVALCAREPNCVPFLQPYMEKIIVLPSDWLAIANFAYFYDCDAAHDYAGKLTDPTKTEGRGSATEPAASSHRTRSATTAAVRRRQSRSPGLSLCSTGRRSPALSAVEARGSRRAGPPGARPACSGTGTNAKGDHRQGAADRDPTRSYIPAALRTALVTTFAKFSVFSMAKYDNEAAEHRAQRRQVRRDRAAAATAAAAPSTSGPDKPSAEDVPSAAPPRRPRPHTFTFKQLIRMLHITEPSYIVCCLLGKRYPSNANDFRRMRLHLTDPTWKKPASLKMSVETPAKGGHSATVTDACAVVSGDGSAGEAEDEGEDRQENAELPFCVFDARRAGQRMHLPVPETWETLLSKEGNTGRVWDALISANAVPYMALLRNLRNILTRLCSAASHKRVLEKLVDEQQIAASQQLPYRFYSAYLAVQQIGTLLEFLDTLRAMPREARSKKEKAASAGDCGERRDLAAIASEPAAGVLAKDVMEAAKSFERPMVPRAYLRRYLTQYCAALDSAVSTSARLNVIPMKGTSIVIICVTSALFEPMSTMGAAAATPVSIQRKVDVTGLLVAMLMRSCEQCVVLLYCYDEYVVFRESDPDEAKAMMQGTCDDVGGSNSSSGTESSSSSSSRRNDTHDDGADEGDLPAVVSPFHRASAAVSQKAAPGMMSLAGALAARCSSLLARKREEVGADVVATSFAMFETAAGAQFPYAFLDEVIERNMRVESLLVFDEGVHRTYANMNRNAPAFGDLPTYLSRLRRTYSPDLLYVGVNLKASNPPPAERVAEVPDTTDAPVTASAAGAPAHRQRRQVPVPALKGGAKVALQKEEVKLRFNHHNDVLLSGFSDSILRLVALRTGGGPLAVIERAAETYHVSRLSARISQAAWAERAKALKVLAALREDQQSHIGPGGPPETPHAAGARTFNGRIISATPSGTTAATRMRSSSFPRTRRSLVADATAVPAAVLPYFNADGKAVSATGWDWSHSSGSSDRRLQWLTSSFAGLSSTSSASTASSAYDAEAPSRGRAALPSIRRLLAKPSFSEAEVAVATVSASGGAVYPARHSDNCDNRESEPAWLAAEGKSVSPIFHPQPFISIVKLLPLLRTEGGNVTTPAAGDTASAAASAAADRPTRKRVGDAWLHAQTAQLTQAGSTGSAATAIASSAGAAAATAIAQMTAGAESVAAHRLHDQVSLLPPWQATTVARRLITSYRLCRFFISSTFLDMNNERNAITLDIFPRLRRWAAEAGLKVTILEVDLRWGIPALATRRNLSTSVCLNEVSRCSPFFVGVIGDRYGSSPPAPLQLVVDEDVDAEDYAWMQELSDPDVSVTELEMRHAMHNAKRRLGDDEAPLSTLFFARDSSHLLSTFGPGKSACRAVYEADSATAAEAIARLKQRITENGFKLLSYQAKYIDPAKALMPGTSRRVSGGAPLLVGGAAQSAVMSSGARAMMEDDLGRWAVRSRHGFGSGAGEAAFSSAERHSGSSGSPSETDSLWSFVKASITESEEPKKLTSTDVAIDMTDFSEQVFHALRGVICRVCGVLPAPDDSAEEKQQQHTDARVPDGDGTEKKADARGRAKSAQPASAATSEALGAEVPDMYEMLMVAQSEFARKLSDLYAAPRGLLERLSSFALNGTLSIAEDTEAPSKAGAEGQRTSSAHGNKHRGNATLTPSPEDAHGSRPLQDSSPLPQQHQQSFAIHAASRGDGTSSILLLEGCDGDGKSSALAALTVRVLTPMLKASASKASPRFLFYSTQAEEDSVRGLLLFLAKSLRVFFQLYGEVSVNDTDSVEELLLVLDQVYAAVHRRFQTSCGGTGRTSVTEGRRGDSDDQSAAGRASPGAGHAALVVMLDGLDKSSEAAELVSLLGTILHPLATQHIRFVVSACPRSSLARALRTRAPPARVLSVPVLSEGERAELVRLHLANYGKLLEESFAADELKNLLRKSGTGRPSYLISAITHLRLFSTFDTLREDIRSLPTSRAALHVQLFHHLQSRFDADTCRVVLSILLLRQPVGGVLEFNLYRLVSDVAAASRLVTLLRGICLDSHHGRLFIKSSTFVAAIAQMFFRFTSDYQCAQERILLAELCYQPIDISLEEQEVKAGLLQVTESIRRSAVDPLTRRTFVPERYAPRELLGVLQGSVQACRLDVIAALVCYLPFLECLLLNPRMLSQLVGLLSSVLSAATSASSLAPSAAGAAVATRAEDNAEVEDMDSVRPLVSYRALALQWRHYRSEARRLSDVLEILRKNYDVLLRQPGLLRQCVWNTAGPTACISAFDAASTARLQQALQKIANESATASYEERGSPLRECQRAEDGASPTPAARSSNKLVLSAPSTMWVRWLNTWQHGGEGCVMRITASPQSIRCMAMSPDGTEVALGGDDGVVRRVSADVDADEQQQQQLASSETKSVGGAACVGRRRVASTLRHESAVTSVMYVSPRAAGSPAAGTNVASASTTVSAPSGAAQLLVSGCARGLLYVWSLEDNSLLQRGAGHLRAISGLVCHPLEPTVLCSCGHDTFVMLWDIGRADAPSRLGSEIQASLALRMPKHPADSAERLRQRTRVNVKEQSRVVGGGVGSATMRQDKSTSSTGTRGQQTSFKTLLVPFHTERQHRTPLAAIAFHRSGDIFASGSWDGLLVLHNTRELRTPSPVITPEMKVPFEPPKQTRATGRRRRRGKVVWRTRHGPEHRQVTFQSTTFALGSSVRAAVFSNSLAVTCVVGCHNGAVVVVDHASAAVVARWTSLHSAPVTRLTASLDGRCMASADEHGVVRLTHTGITGSVFATFNGHNGAVTGLCFRPPRADHSEDIAAATDPLQAPPAVLLTAGEDCTLQAWRVDSSGSGSFTTQTTMPRRPLSAAHSTAITAVASSRDGQLLVTGSADGTAIVFRLPEEEEEDDDVVCRGAVGAATGRECAGAATLNRSEASGKKVMTTFSTAAGGAPTTRPLKPAFTLRHDGCRITRICLAMRDTRIVVGVVFGLVYVWSSSPGLNQVEGRLLLRVRVPEHGLYPVVSLGVVERSGVAAMADYQGHREAGKDGVAQQTWGVETPLPLAYRRTPSSAAATAISTSPPAESKEESSALVTAICANGDVAVFKLLGDAASLVMAADQTRRRQRHLRHHQHSIYSVTSFPDSAFSQGDSISGASISDTSEGPAVESGVAVSALASKSFGWVERVESGGAGVDVAHYARATTTAANSAPQTLEDGLVTAQQGCSRPRPPTTGGAPRGPVDTAVSASASSLPQRVISTEGLRRRWQTLDRRTQKLQRLLSQCRATEVELRNSCQLHLHRHRLLWANAADAEEIMSVVWLSSQHPQPSHSGDVADAVQAKHGRLALVVAQRRLFLLFSNGRESALSRCLSVRLSSHTPDGASLLDSVTGAMPEEGMAVVASECSASCGAACREDGVVPLEADEAAAAEEFEVDLDYLLREGEHFTSASSAVEDAPVSPLAATAEAIRWFAVAVTTSQGEVLLLRVEVPHIHGKLSDALDVKTAPLTDAQARPSAAASQHLSSYILPRTSITLYRRLGFTGSVAGQAAAAEGDGAEAGASGAALHRMTAAPRATCVELCALPPALVASVDASATSLPLAATGAATAQKVVLFAGCTDGSTRVWLAATPPPVPHSRRGSPAGAEADEVAELPRVGGTTDVSIGCFFCTGSVSVVSIFLNCSVQHAGGSGAVVLAPSSRWIVGDTLGNVYQLQLERDPPGGVATLLDKSCDMLGAAGGGARRGNIEARLTRLSPVGISAKPWAWSFQRSFAVMSSAPPASSTEAMLQSCASGNADESDLAGGGMVADEAFGTLRWPGWLSHSPADWLAPVNVSSALPTLLRRHAPAAGARAGAAPVWRSADDQPQTAIVSPSVGTPAFALRVIDETPQFLTAAPLHSTRVGLPLAPWSYLPDLPPVQRGSSTVFSSSRDGIAEGASMRGDGEPARLSALSGFGLASPPAALPSFATGPCTSWSALEHRGANSDGGEAEVTQSSQKPLRGLLAGDCRQGAGGSTGAAAHCEMPTVASPTPPSSQSLLHNDPREHLSKADDEDDYFAVLYEANPPTSQSPCGSGAEARRAWMLHQREVLEEATRVQRYNRLARRALEAYRERMAMVVVRGALIS